ncbi:MAG: hypothetical protein AABO58_08815 [Acidobacteriota bacterium]
MKRFVMTIAALSLAATLANAQTPTATPVAGNPDWSRTGNSTPPSNVIGTFFSSPMYFYTDGLLRMRINSNLTSTVNTFTRPRNGYVGIGENIGQLWSIVNPGPFSLLHLNGPNGGQQFGYRPWMQTGISLTSNDDFAYIGHKQNTPPGGNVLDITDLVIAWGDNATAGVGPDMMKFVFTSGNGSSGNDLIGDSLDGREIMRLTGWGNVGIGPRFNNTPAGQPQSQLHINSENNANATLQLTVQNLGQTAADGLRLSVDNVTGNARIDQQERANLLFFTNTSSTGGERMRITSVATPGTINPGAFTLDETRVAISHRPGQLTQPLSLLHIGENTGPFQDGWRRWMDVGTLASQGSDHIFVGLKQRLPINPLIPDRFDAVIAWGDNPANPSAPLTGPDYLRFIFTSTTASGFDPLAASLDGHEVMRITPGGQVGIGDYDVTNPCPGLSCIGARLDIDGDLRIRTLNKNNNLTQVLVADPNDRNRVLWRDATTLSSAIVGDPAEDWVRAGGNMVPFVLADNVGVGTSSPLARLHVVQNVAAPTGDQFALRVQNSSTVSNGHRIGLEVQNSGPMGGPRDDVGIWVRTVNGNPNPHANMAAVLDGNVVIGSLSVGNQEIGTQGRYVLSMRDGSAPITPLSAYQGIQLWSQGGELRVRDSSMNITTLSPHNFSLFARSEPMAWSYYGENRELNKKIGVDMLRVIRVVERMSGETLAHIQDIDDGSSRDDAGFVRDSSSGLIGELRAELTIANERISALEAQIAEVRAMLAKVAGQ